MSATEWRYVRVRRPGGLYDGICGRVNGWTHDGLLRVEHVRSGDCRLFEPGELEDITEAQYAAWERERSGQG